MGNLRAGVCRQHPKRHALGQLVDDPADRRAAVRGFGIAESIVERSPKKAFVRGGICLPAGIVLGFVIHFIAGFIFMIGLSIVAEMGAQTERNPAFWIVRGIAWMVFGAAGGVLYGLIGLSAKKTLYGVLG